MSDELLELSIVRTEGLTVDPQSTGCYVQVDGRLHDVITPLCADNQENEVQVPTSGLVRLIVKNMACASEVLGSVSFDVKILNPEGFQWLPLFSIMAKDRIFQLPEEVDKQKVLILINPNKMESLEQDADSNLNSSIIKEMQELMHEERRKHEKEMMRVEKQYKGVIERMAGDNDKSSKSCRKYFLLFEDVGKELKASKLLLVEERKLRCELQEKMGKVAMEYEENLKRAHLREDALLKKLEEKDKEISELNSTVSQLKSTVRSLDFEKQQIVDVVDEYKTELTLSNITRLNQELVLVKSLLEESEAQRHKLQSFIQEIPETPTKLSTFMSPISLGSSIERTDDAIESRQLNLMMDQLVPKSDRSKCESQVQGSNSVLWRSEGAVDEGSKTHRRGVTVGAAKVTDENEEIVTVRCLKSPPDASLVIKPESKCVSIQSNTPLRERNSNKRFSKRAPFK